MDLITTWMQTLKTWLDTLLGSAPGQAVGGAIVGATEGIAGAAQSVTSTWDVSHLAALAAALGWASGMRLYMVVFLVGAAGFMGWLPLPPGLSVLQHPAVLGASFLMFAVEFVADKIPGVDSLWDSVHTFIRVPAGAALAYGALNGAMGVDANTWGLLAALMGGTLAATSHAAKATTRAAANTSPEPFSNIALSLLGDAAVPTVLWLAWQQPEWFWPVLAVLVLIATVLIVVLFKFLRALLRRVFPAAPRALA